MGSLYGKSTRVIHINGGGGFLFRFSRMMMEGSRQAPEKGKRLCIKQQLFIIIIQSVSRKPTTPWFGFTSAAVAPFLIIQPLCIYVAYNFSQFPAPE